MSFCVSISLCVQCIFSVIPSFCASLNFRTSAVWFLNMHGLRGLLLTSGGNFVSMAPSEIMSLNKQFMMCLIVFIYSVLAFQQNIKDCLLKPNNIFWTSHSLTHFDKKTSASCENVTLQCRQQHVSLCVGCSFSDLQCCFCAIQNPWKSEIELFEAWFYCP